MSFHVQRRAAWPRTEEATLVVPLSARLSTKPGIELAMWIQNKSEAQFRRFRIEYAVVLGNLTALAYLPCSRFGQC